MKRLACAQVVLLVLGFAEAVAAEGPVAEDADAVEGQEEIKELDVGRFYIGAVYSFGLGSSFIDGDATGLQEIGVGAGLSLGVKLPSERLWCEIGATVGPYASRARMGDGASDEGLSAEEEETLSKIYGTTMPFYLEVRFLVPLKAPYVYWASSLLPGFFVHESHYENAEYDVGVSNTHLSVSTALRTGLAIVLNDWVEIRLDVAGMELIFEEAFGVLYAPSFAIVLRI